MSVGTARASEPGNGLISDAYRAQQTTLHDHPQYGIASEANAPLVAEFAKQLRPASILDYGAGKGRLGPALKKLLDFEFEIRCYDPAIVAFAATPEPADLVACIDVLEHIEPDRLEAVLDDLQRVTGRIGIFTVATGPAMKTLPDGRNAHLIQEGPGWWMPKLFARFEVRTFMAEPEGFWVLVARKA